MCKPLIPFVVMVLLTSILVTPRQTAFAQTITLPAEINKSFSPISIAAGGISRLSVTVFNPNGFTLADTSWTDNLVRVQPGLSIAGSVGLTNTCGGAVTAVTGATSFSLSGGTVPAQTGTTPGSCTVSVNVTSTTVGNLINTIPAGALSSTGGGTTITNTSPASATLNVNGGLPPGVSKSFSPGTIWAGNISQLTITIRNSEQGTSLTQVSLTDNLPANVFLANPVNLSNSCGGTVNAVAGGTSVTLTNGDIGPNSSCTITVNVTSSVQGAYTNRIPANALQTQQGLTNSTPATARLNVQEIGLTKRFTPSTFSAGGTTTLLITLQNPTASPYTSVSFTDVLPVPLTPVSVTSNTCGGTTSITGTAITLTGGTIPAGSPTIPGTCTISIQITAPAGTASGIFTNTIPPNGLTTGQGIGNLRPANANVTVSGTDMTGTKSFSPSTIAAGGNSRLRIDIFAPSDTPLTGFSMTDNLPAGVMVSNSTPAAVTGCGTAAVLDAPTGATTISLTNGEIPASQRCRIDVYVTSNTPNPLTGYTNTIMPSNIANNQGRTLTTALTASLIVTDGGLLSIDLVKGFDPLIVTGGAASTLSIEVHNPSSVTLTGIAFTDNMPSNMILYNPVNPNVGTCGGTISGTPGENSFSFSGGSLPPLGRCTLTLSATITVNGNLTNTIPAGTVTTDNGVTNADPAEATLTNLPGASIGKFFAPNPIPAGSYSLLTITIRNTGNIGLAGLGLSDSLPTGLSIAGESAPAPVNNCGGTFTAVAGTQLIELTDGALEGSSSCTMVIPITGSSPGNYQNTIPQGSLRTAPGVSVTNNLAAVDTLIITGEPSEQGGGRRGRRGSQVTPAPAFTPTGFFIPVTGFAAGTVTHLDVSSRPVYSATDLRLDIPVINVQAPIVGVESKEGSWDVSWLQDQVGWLNRTSYPTWKGNSLLTAHVVGANGKPGVFSRLKSLGIGEYIFVYNAGYRYTYEVESNVYVQPDDSSVMKHEEESYLTLITCDSYDEAAETYLRRVVVRAVLVDVRTVIQ